MGETRKLAAILVSDVVGYSRLAGADEDRILARLRTLRSDLIDPTIAVHHGGIVKRTGDGAIVEFRSVVDAVRCGIEVQNGMRERNAGVPDDQKIQFRIGIHLGDVVEESDGDLMGDGINIAARLQSIAQPGAICLSEQAYWQVKQRLDLKVSDLGATRLKNIAEPIHVYSLEVGAPGQPKTVPQGPPPASVAKLRRLFWPWPAIAVMLGLALLAAAGTYAWHSGLALRMLGVAGNAPSNASRLSIVVLPLANLSGDPAQDYLTDALTDLLTTSLARIPSSFVIARNTAYTYKGKPVDVKAIGKDLGVRYVLEGSVQLGGAQVRVNAQLIDTDSGAHVWAEQFDTPRADLLQMQDEIVTHLARAMQIQLPGAEDARLKRTPTTNPTAEDLSWQCQAGVFKGGFIGKEAEAGFRLCEQSLELDPNNVRALNFLSFKYWLPVMFGRSAEPQADLKRGDELISKALALNPNSSNAHLFKAYILTIQGRYDEAVAEDERTLALDPTNVNAYEGIGTANLYLGEFEKSLEFYDKAIRLSPHDPALQFWYGGKASAYFALKQYDQAIEWARRSIATKPNNPYAYLMLIAALALTGHEAEAHETLEQYLALPPIGARTIAAYQATKLPRTDPRFLEVGDRVIEGLRKAGMPEVAEDKLVSAPHLSIVVLPFTNLSGDPSKDYFADGITETLTTDLSRLRGSFVIGRNTAFTFKGKSVDAKAIGKELGVHYVLEGSVQRDQSHVRVNAQLVDADSGGQLWAERFDKPLADLFDMQDEIVASVASQLGAELITNEARRAERTPTPDSMDLYFQGMAWLNRGRNPEDLARARGYFERALALDPDNLDASLGAISVDLQAVAGYQTDDHAARYSAIEATLTKVLSQSPNNAWAHYMICRVQTHTNRQAQGIAECERALALNPNLANARAEIGLTKLYEGRAEETERHELEALRISPRDTDANVWVAYIALAKLYLGADADAAAFYRRSMDINRNYATGHINFAAALEELGRHDEARAEVQAALALNPEFTLRRYRAGAQSDNPIYLTRREQLIEAMRKAGAPEG
jgi:adenylate cyclase